MLVLSRQSDQSIMIGDDIEIFVVEVRGDKVRLGINAPRHVPVHRKEVYDSLAHANRAARPAPGALRSILRLLSGHRGEHPHGEHPPAAAGPRGNERHRHRPPRRDPRR